MLRRVKICFILLLAGAMFLASGCGGEEPVTCGGQEDFCRWLAEEAETVVLGQVISFNPEHQRTEPTETEKGIVFSDWDVEVERYIINPQPFQIIQVRLFIAEVYSPDLPTPPLKGPPLNQGERVLLFLDKQEPSNTQLEENQFTIVGSYPNPGITPCGKLLVQNGKARNALFYPPRGEPPWEPLDEIIAAITET